MNYRSLSQSLFLVILASSSVDLFLLRLTLTRHSNFLYLGLPTTYTCNCDVPTVTNGQLSLQVIVGCHVIYHSKFITLMVRCMWWCTTLSLQRICNGLWCHFFYIIYILDTVVISQNKLGGTWFSLIRFDELSGTACGNIDYIFGPSRSIEHCNYSSFLFSPILWIIRI